MEAIVFEEFGGPEVLHLKEIDEVHAGPGQIRVKVAAAGVNPVDYKIRHGWMQAAFPTELPATPGLEVAGTVDEIGAGVTGVAVGDEVLGWSETGSYAQYALAIEFAPKPAGLAWETAVALPVAGETAQRVLDLLAVREGETLLVHGASGAVGSVGVQLAVARGVKVVGTASPANHEVLRALGAIPVAYGEGLAERVREAAPQGVDAVFEAAGHGDLPALIEARGGATDRVVTILDPMSAAEHGVVFTGESTADRSVGLAEQARLVADGKLKVQVAEVFPLALAAKAQQLSEEGHGRGKLVLKP
ncbi:NADP-dependent oxidoreductase [Streptomyces beijiangensis]|uniref:NADP-dependent oxidoreductase n=1 Tax=Streptomyces beijiangensis TaxID=163361 RepID=A0A939JGQ5_9ACTN|nr:NADP-dependent oxidoreductase [Streptomyces beijiangensis]MBO0511802.1 NADP-dependent oxidoreductase [Streptomyces beijiangensis]